MSKYRLACRHRTCHRHIEETKALLPYHHTYHTTAISLFAIYDDNVLTERVELDQVQHEQLIIVDCTECIKSKQGI